MKIKIIVTSLLVSIVAAVAQEAETPPKFVRFLPLGDPPPWREKLVNGVRIQQKAKPGQQPPPKVILPSADGADKTLMLRLGRPTAYKKLNSESPVLSLMPSLESSAPWLKTKMPKAPLSLAILLRNPAVKPATWEKAGIRLIKDDIQSFPKNSFRLVNMSTGKASFKIDDGKEVVLKKGEVKVVTLPNERFLLVVKAAGLGSKVETLHKSYYETVKGERVSAYIYLADGEKRTRKNRFKIFSERYQAPRAT